MSDEESSWRRKCRNSPLEEEEEQEEEQEEEFEGDPGEDSRDQPHSGPLSSEAEAQRGDSAGWQCTPPSASPSGGETPSRPLSRPPPSRHASQSTSRSLAGSKKRSSKPAHMRRNIRKLLKEHQLDAVTKAAHQEELERRRRLKHPRKDLPSDYALAGLSQSSGGQQADVCLGSSSIGQQDGKPLARATPPLRDDVIDLSSGEDDLHITGAATGDATPKGVAHVDDTLNQPDASGRVLVNLNHPASDPDLFLSPQLAHAVKPHQIGGIRFLYDNLVESLQRFESSSGLGCILAHSMGLGKTLQVISFIDVLLRHTQAHTVLAIVPVNTLQNWLAEFNLWVPPPEALPPDTDPALVTPRAFKVHILNDEHKTTASRAKVVEDWASAGGVLLMGYEMYRLLSMKKSFVAGRKRKSKKQACPVVVDLDEEDRQQELLGGIERALSRPGPDVVICDEGHRIKNCHASTSQALKHIHTQRRVVLTGYPLQNSLLEYWCMVDFVRPDFLGTRQEFSNMFERPILNGQCVDSTAQDLRLMRYRSHVLHSLLEGFVQRRGHDVLRDQLPSKDEHVILVRLSPLQRALYTEFMNRFKEAGNSGWLSLNPLKAFCVCCKIWNHPDVLYETLQKENLVNEQDLDLDDITTTGPARCPPTHQKAKLPEMENPDAIGGLSLTALQEKANQVVTYEWAKDIMSGYETGVLENSAKMVLLFHLIEESVRTGDKILVFSQSLSTLTVIEEFLAKRQLPPSPGQNQTQKQNWIRNQNYYRLDGSTSASERERLINQFNDPSNTSAWVFLLSTRAGCLGVNLIGANRVVVFDASWNPCHDAQAVCRVYRYGQKKPCHIYRLVCDFTLEKKIYDRQISKQGMSDRVVDDLNPVLAFTRREVESLLHFVEEEPEAWQVQLQSEEHMETVIRKACQLHPHLITKQPFHHESLLMDRRELKLTKAEKKAARKSYEDEKRASVPYTRPSYAHYYPASDQSLTNIPAFSQRNWRPPPTRPEEKPGASVRPVRSTPVPVAARQTAPGSASLPASDSNSGFPVNYLQKAGVFVQKIVTTTDIVIPGAHSSTDVKARISAGESIHVIRGSKGTYIRASDGRIFAIRAAAKPKPGEENCAAGPKDAQNPPEDESTNGGSAFVAADREQLSSEGAPRPVSPDGLDILSELQRYAVRPGDEAGAHETPPSAVSGGPQERAPESTKNNSHPTTASMYTNGERVTTDNPATANGKRPGDAVAPGPVRPDVDATAALDLRAAKRKASSPSLDERASKQPGPGHRSSAPPPSPGFPFPGARGLPSLGLSPAMLGAMGAMGHPLFMGAGSPYFHPPGQRGDPRLVFPMGPEPFHLGGGALPRSSSRSTSTTTTTTSTPTPSSSSFSSSAATASSGLPPFMLGAAGMAGMVPSGYHLPYSQALGGLYPASVLPGGLPAAMPGPAGASFLSHYTPTSSSSSSPSSSSGLLHPDGHGSTENGDDRRSSSDEGDDVDDDDDDDDDDVIEVMGQ